MYSDMSRRIIARSSSNRNSASARASSVLPTPVGPMKINEPIGRLGSESPARLRRTALDTRIEGVFLADNPLAQALFHGHQFLGFAFEQAADGDAGPFAYQRGDIFFVHFFLQHPPALLGVPQTLLGLV